MSMKVGEVAREIACATYMRPEDAKIVEAWAKENSASISFRMAGLDTLKCLGRGAGAKPHEIADKTLKIRNPNNPSGADKAVYAFIENFSEDKGVAEDLLMGLVGHWSQGQVDGIYLTKLGEKTFDKNASKEDIPKEYIPKEEFSVGRNKKEMPFLVLNDAAEKKKLISFFKSLYGGPEEWEKAHEKNAAAQAAAQADKITGKKPDTITDKEYYLFTRLFFSGDYDVHDLLSAGEIVPSGEDEKFLSGLRKILKAGRRTQIQNRFHLTDNDFEGEVPEDYCRVQHGPQYNYAAQMISENLKLLTDNVSQDTYLENLNVLVGGVLDMDPPVAMHSCRVAKAPKWAILENYEHVCGFYHDEGLQVKSTWTEQSERDKHVIHVIKTAIHFCFPKALFKKEVDLEMMQKKAPEFKELYGENFYTYADKAMDDLGLLNKG